MAWLSLLKAQLKALSAIIQLMTSWLANVIRRISALA
jgi:hypothetical protein